MIHVGPKGQELKPMTACYPLKTFWEASEKEGEGRCGIEIEKIHKLIASHSSQSIGPIPLVSLA